MPKGQHRNHRDTGPKAGGDAAVAERRAMVAQLIRRGWSKSAIALHCKLSAGQITQDFKAIVEAAKKAQIERGIAIKEMMIEELHEVKREAWSEWERSKEMAEKRTTTTVEDAVSVPVVPDGVDPSVVAGVSQVKTTNSITTEGKIGDARLLKIVKECIDSEAELHGLKTKDATPSNVINWHVLVNGLPQEVPDDIEAEIMSVNGEVPSPPADPSTPQIGLKELPE